MPPFAVRLRAYSAAHLGPSEGIRCAADTAVCTIVSEYTGPPDKPFSYPVTLLAEARGEADDVWDAQEQLVPPLEGLLPWIAIATNAAIAEPQIVMAHGLDLSEPQELLACDTPNASDWFPPPRRRVPRDSTLAFLASLTFTPPAHAGLLVRAGHLYLDALRRRLPYERTLAAEFLYMSAETLSRYLVARR